MAMILNTFSSLIIKTSPDLQWLLIKSIFAIVTLWCILSILMNLHASCFVGYPWDTVQVLSQKGQSRSGCWKHCPDGDCPAFQSNFRYLIVLIERVGETFVIGIPFIASFDCFSLSLGHTSHASASMSFHWLSAVFWCLACMRSPKLDAVLQSFQCQAAEDKHIPRLAGYSLCSFVYTWVWYLQGLTAD